MTAAKTFNHRTTPHTCISMPPSRAAAIRKAAALQGLSNHVWIQKAITAGLTLFAIAEVEDGE